MNNYHTIVVLILLLTISIGAQANDILYINGIQNKDEGFYRLNEAEKTGRKLQNLLDSSTNRTDKKKFNVYYLYNPSGFDDGFDGYIDELQEDLEELFRSKKLEEDYSGKYYKISASHNSGSSSLSLDSSYAKAILDNINDELPSFAEPINKGINKINDFDKLIIVSHSQGNLIANYMWASLVEKYGNQAFLKARVVNVANTTMFSPNGLNFTHAGDSALFESADVAACPEQSLETLAVRKEWSRLTSVCKTSENPPKETICNFQLASPTFNSADGEGIGFDACLDHSIVSTYMSKNDVEERTDQNISRGDSFGTRFRDRLEDFIYTAAESLERANAEVTNCLLDTGSVDFEYNGTGNDIVHTNSNTGEARVIATISDYGIFMTGTDYDNCYYHLMMGNEYSLYSVNLVSETVSIFNPPGVVDYWPFDVYKNNSIVGVVPITDTECTSQKSGENCEFNIFSLNINTGISSNIRSITGGIPRQFGTFVDKSSDTITFVTSVFDSSDHGSVDTEYTVNILTGEIEITNVID